VAFQLELGIKNTQGYTLVCVTTLTKIHAFEVNVISNR